MYKELLFLFFHLILCIGQDLAVCRQDSSLESTPPSKEEQCNYLQSIATDHGIRGMKGMKGEKGDRGMNKTGPSVKEQSDFELKLAGKHLIL